MEFHLDRLQQAIPSGEVHSNQARHDAGEIGAVDDTTIKSAGLSKLRIHVQRIPIAAYAGELVDITLGDTDIERYGHSNFEIVKSEDRDISLCRSARPATFNR
jgi:hypothetical protein